MINNPANISTHYPAPALTKPAQDNQQDTKTISMQIEKVFLNELLKNIFEQTEFGKNKALSPFIPFITSEMSDSFAQRGIGVGDFLTRAQQLKNTNKAENTNSNQSKPIYDGNHSQSSPAIQSEGEKVSNSGENISNSNTDFIDVVLQRPAEGRISSAYGIRRDPFDGRLKRHNGIDIALKEGSEIKSASAGKVIYSGKSDSYGQVVIIEHEGGFSTIYGHNSENIAKKGEIVSQGQVIALSGSSGRATGPHLHFEVRKDGVSVNPSSMIG